MKLSDSDKLEVFNMIEDGFDSIIKLICNEKGMIINYSKSFADIYPEIVTEIFSIYSIIENESVISLKKLLSPPGDAVIHFKTPEAIIETFSCKSKSVTEGTYIFGVREKSTYKSNMEIITRQRNIMHQKLLNRMSNFEKAFIEINENCIIIHNFFEIIMNKFKPVSTLTDREFEIFILLSKQQSSIELAEYLNITESTVDKHLQAIKNKTGYSSLAEIATLSRKFNEGAVSGELNISKIYNLTERNSHLLRTVLVYNKMTDSEINLTKRESEILTLIIGNKTNNDIANILFLSENTIKSHITRIFKKLNLHSRKELSQLKKY